MNKINRFKEISSTGLVCDLVWSDPKIEINSFEFNDNRNCSLFYGRKALDKFLKENKLKTIIRAHEVQLEGYKITNFGNE